jgi:hypothetical protein
MEGMQPESRRNRRLSVGFGIAGHAMSVYRLRREKRDADVYRLRREEEDAMSFLSFFLYLLLQNLQV